MNSDKGKTPAVLWEQVDQYPGTLSQGGQIGRGLECCIRCFTSGTQKQRVICSDVHLGKMLFSAV